MPTSLPSSAPNAREPLGVRALVHLMLWRISLTCAIIVMMVAVLSTTRTAFASADDYAFEPLRAQIRSSNIATIAVRLVRKSTGKPVPDATIVQTLLDMAPDGMADMATTAIVPLPSPEPGVYAFKAPLTMAGHWRLTISAKVQGEPEPVIGKLTFEVTR